MKIVVIGGTGLIGTKVVANLRSQGHEVIAAAPSNGINTITGEGLTEAMNNTEVVVDLANSPSFEGKAALEFFQTAGQNLLSAEVRAGIRHHVALSIVGVEQMQNVGYMQAKLAQENLIRQSGIPYTIIRSTQFLEFLSGIAKEASQGNEVHLSSLQFQPIASDDVAFFVSTAALSSPVNGIFEIAGPVRYTLAGIVGSYLKDTGDPRTVVPNDNDWYYGGKIPNAALVPTGEARSGSTSYEKWLSHSFQKT